MGETWLADADHAALARLVTEIVWRIDHGQADTVHELFVEDGEMVLGPASLTGREQIATWGRERAGSPFTSRHVCTNMRFVPDGTDGALGSTVVTVYRYSGAGLGDTTAHGVGEYTDRFVRTADGWRFVSRRIDLHFASS